jgi:hypothetical protein
MVYFLEKLLALAACYIPFFGECTFENEAVSPRGFA